MSREIKFRAWSKKRKSYRELDQLVFDNQGLEEIWVFPKNNETQQVYNPSEMIIEQFTGLKDKNGKEIYEGDIVTETIDDGDNKIIQIYEVYWDEDMLNFGIRGTKGFNYNLHDELWETNASREVIGNIHENPELLEDK